MKTEVKEQKKNPLLKRNEAVISIVHAGKATPSRVDILEIASKELKVDKQLIIVDSVFTEAGRNISNARILTYSKKEDIPEYKLKKMKSKKKQAEGEAKPEEKPKEDKPKGEKPAEKPKEDKPAEK